MWHIKVVKPTQALPSKMGFDLLPIKSKSFQGLGISASLVQFAYVSGLTTHFKKGPTAFLSGFNIE